MDGAGLQVDRALKFCSLDRNRCRKKAKLWSNSLAACASHKNGAAAAAAQRRGWQKNLFHSFFTPVAAGCRFPQFLLVTNVHTVQCNLPTRNSHPTNPVSRNLPANNLPTAETTHTLYSSLAKCTHQRLTHQFGLLNLGGENLSLGELPPNSKFPKGKFTPQELPLPSKLGCYKRDMASE